MPAHRLAPAWLWLRRSAPAPWSMPPARWSNRGPHRRRAGRTERGCDLARDDAALPHARHNYAPAASMQHLDGGIEGTSHGAGDAVSQRAQRLRLNADHVFADGSHSGKWYQSAGKGYAELAGFCRLDSAELPREFFLRRLHLIKRLSIHPEFRCGPKETREPHGGIGGDASLLENN